ncbi:MAG: hypothetical protein OES38_19620 [Gammaproteobacteria bacterium]|nr:hypothetical protein [Gammaproteobacteria bacterium]
MVTALLIIALVSIGILSWFMLREIGKSREFFKTLAAGLDGHATRLPFGAVFQLGSTQIRIFALQGSIYYRARVHLRENPGVLVTRKFPRLRFLDRLNHAPFRQSFLFHTPVDEHYGFRARDSRWMREIFDAELQRRMIETGRVTRIEVKRRAVTGALLMLSHSDDERKKAAASIEIMNQVLMRVLGSSLVRGGGRL